MIDQAGVAQWQSNRFVSDGLEVRLLSLALNGLVNR